MTKKTPKGYERGPDGVLRFIPAWRREHHNEAVWFVDGHGERFGCTATVFSDSRDYSGHPCGKTAKHDHDEAGNPTRCGIHSQAAHEKRRARQEAKYEAEAAARRKRWAKTETLEALQKEAAEIIRAIADGHNDPRAISADWVKRFDEASK